MHEAARRGQCSLSARHAYLTTTYLQGASATTLWATLPRNSASTAPRPPLPSTIMSAET
jgi:hypothetical protein